ncbi:SOS response-associated peptidase [Caproiciproducens faecalis]|uniref:Abasic site processing protein n=1 Tax=Caproiciproducens faecalis TaxID=2820301 RepID=A0ABS7DQU2_9FIRM|nr:SOS response-associated peptidase [Caproiciproducens faecalis]MBW7573185.1 SOS response-associated peptidase [Caproiciproducens faecalis]
MCGRYVLFSDTEMQDIRDIIDEVQRKVNGEMKTGEIFPTDKAPVLIQEQGIITPDAVKWGFPNFRNKGVVINARAETAPEKPMFRRSLETKRCIIPCTGFYEWSHNGPKTKYQFNLPESGALYMAGLWNDFDGERRFAILTTEANVSMSEIHNRMPVVLTRPEMQLWMNNYQDALDVLQTARPELIKTPA